MQMQQNSQRAIRTLFADLKTCRKRWESLNTDSLKHAQNIVNTVLQLLYIKQLQSWSHVLEDFNSLNSKYQDKVTSQLPDLKEKLNSFLSKIAYQHKKMLIIKQQMEQVVDEAVSNLGVEYLSSLPIFVSFTLSDCSSIMNEIIDMYTVELNLKRTIFNNLLKINDRKEGMLYISCWINEPYINLKRLNDIEELIESEFSS
ncbi:hypothetical protein LY90DRAFT_674845 [Neocallimastix californiae]|uniref:Uncharacterized protein n=1 Tax=Neocallimastix californiae TaxID=1754190 RepID=A0A1Y2AT81_9FUNG|nr:hypothetical protein LY90DRAFT_674845 [Neocallimastix californiae]|eukprot:ORY25500.1 hypothetical protein LY90DRAFT_674845 [Neocallimastix californiae]